LIQPSAVASTTGEIKASKNQPADQKVLSPSSKQRHLYVDAGIG
jgi:hypothetical protein